MPTVAELVAALDRIAPFRLAEEWDNVGLLVGRRDAPVARAMLAIDATPAVIGEAAASGCEAIVAYHPPIFRPLKRLGDATPAERVALELAARGIAALSPHTALDAAPGGLNDWIADGIGPGDRKALVPAATLPATEEVKIVTFAPPEAIERIRDGLAAAGAGRIGGYERCSFELAGTGTFFGGDSTRPAVGGRGRLERVAEARLEMVCPRKALPIALEALRRFHPYEEPPVEIHPLEPRPIRATGGGRKLTLDRALPVDEIADRLKRHFGVATVSVALPDGAPSEHAAIGICAGAGESLLDAAIAEGCTLFVTGEMRHHEVLSALARGCGVLLAGHTNTERGYLPSLAARLAREVPGLETRISTCDRDPLQVR
jgi:dinuclear metal center YbgI/SA1388 family protein